MSLVTIPEAKKLEQDIEVEGIVKSMSRKDWHPLKNSFEYSLGCMATLCDGKGNQIPIAFRDADARKVRNNLKIKIIGWKKSIYNILIRGTTGKIELLGFSPTCIKNDIQNLKNRNKITSFRDYYNLIKNDCSRYYNGIDKKHYEKIARAFSVIETLKKSQRRSYFQSTIRFLHNEISLSSNEIAQISKIFDIHISARIIQSSLVPTSTKITRNTPKIEYKIYQTNPKSNTLRIETNSDELPFGMCIIDDKNSENLSSFSLLDVNKIPKGYDA